MDFKLSRSITIASLIGLSSVFANPAYAGDQSAGVVTNISSNPAIYSVTTGAFFFSTSGTRTGAPTCATIPGRWVIDASLTGSQQTIALIVSAQATGKSIQVHGTGHCEVWGDTETVNYIQISY